MNVWDALEKLERQLTPQQLQRLTWIKSKKSAVEWLDAHGGLDTMQHAKRLAFASFLYASGRINEGCES